MKIAEKWLKAFQGKTSLRGRHHVDISREIRAIRAILTTTTRNLSAGYVIMQMAYCCDRQQLTFFTRRPYCPRRLKTALFVHA